MRFLSIYKSVERNTPPTPKEMETMGKPVEELRQLYDGDPSAR